MCNGKYYVDFTVKHYWNGNEDSTKFHLYLIEFDEEEHEHFQNKLADLARDSEIKNRSRKQLSSGWNTTNVMTGLILYVTTMG